MPAGSIFSNQMSTETANALTTPPAVEPTPAVTGIPPQDVIPAGSGDAATNAIEAYEKERAAFLAEPDAPVVEAVPPAAAHVVTAPPAEAPPLEDEVEVETAPPPVGETPLEKAPRYRLKPQDGVEAVAFKLRAEADKAGTPISMKEAIARAEAAMPSTAAPAVQAQTLTPPGSEASYEQVAEYLRTAQPATEAEAQTLVALCRSKRKDAMSKDLNMEAVADLDDILIDLGKHTETLRNRAASQYQQQVTAFHQASDASKVKALDLYPDTGVANSPLVLEMVRLDKVLKDSGNPLYGQADKPEKLAMMAANNLGIAPGAKPVVSPQPVVKTRPAQPPIASGGARTTQATAPTGQLEDRLNKISTPEDLEAAKRELAAMPV